MKLLLKEYVFFFYMGLFDSKLVYHLILSISDTHTHIVHSASGMFGVLASPLHWCSREVHAI